MQQTRYTIVGLFIILLCAYVAQPFVVHAATKKVAVTKKAVVVKKTAKKPTPKYSFRRLDGVPVKTPYANLMPVAVMVDNFTTARPQSSLSKASVVYEALAEGGIPRFMAVFGERGMNIVGPVRSTRPYFLRYAAEYPAALVHAGGSPDAQTLLRKLRLVNVEGVIGKTAKYFFRLHGGNGVHDLYTTGANITTAMRLSTKEKNASVYRMWKFGGDASLAKRGKGGSGVTANIGAGRSYDIKYVYDRNKNVYLRFTGGKPHLDKTTGKQLAAKNVILQFVPKEKVLDKKGRLDIKTTGSGKALLLQNGHAVTITWKKKDDRGRTVFYDSQKHEMTFVRGTIWITVVPKGHPYKVM